MEYHFEFPKDLYAEVRMEERSSIWLSIKNGEIENDGESAEAGAMVRVFDGNMWYTATTNSFDEIQEQLDALAKIAVPNSGIYEHPIVTSWTSVRSREISGRRSWTDMLKSAWIRRIRT